MTPSQIQSKNPMTPSQCKAMCYIHTWNCNVRVDLTYSNSPGWDWTHCLGVLRNSVHYEHGRLRSQTCFASRTKRRLRSCVAILSLLGWYDRCYDDMDKIIVEMLWNDETSRNMAYTCSITVLPFILWHPLYQIYRSYIKKFHLGKFLHLKFSLILFSPHDKVTKFYTVQY